jgi:hypothetical protein
MIDSQAIHLTDEQFAECAFGGGEIPAEAASHLQQCAACREELAKFRASVESFNQVSMAWSESRPAESLRGRVRTEKAQPRWAVVSWALAGCLAVASAVSIGTRLEDQRDAAKAHPPASADVSEAQIERDNKLLLAVDEATSVRPVSPLQEYGIEESSTGRVKGHTSRSAND